MRGLNSINSINRCKIHHCLTPQTLTPSRWRSELQSMMTAQVLLNRKRRRKLRKRRRRMLNMTRQAMITQLHKMSTTKVNSMKRRHLRSVRIFFPSIKMKKSHFTVLNRRLDCVARARRHSTFKTSAPSTITIDLTRGSLQGSLHSLKRSQSLNQKVKSLSIS